ncbi:MAG: UDP-N-acetylmuramate dehydrogenase [bacterium]
MRTAALSSELEKIPGLRVRTGVELARLTTFKVGGPAAVLATPETAESLQALQKIVGDSGTPLFILGNGSNVLVADEGFDGVVVRIGSALGGIEVAAPDRIRIGAGTLWSKVLRFAGKEGWTGFEFGAGIPGTLGGACATNAGTRGGETADRLLEVVGVDAAGEIRALRAADLGFRYRGCDLPDGFIVTGTLFSAERGDPARIEETVRGYQAERRRDQPEREPSAGCIFKNPKGASAGKLIDLAGLKGEREGAAVVSPVHGNFIINTGGATAVDVLKLIDRVRERVLAAHGVTIELEIRKMGFA